MTVTRRLFAATAAFLAVAGAVYAVWSDDRAGLTMLVLAAALAAWLSFYLWRLPAADRADEEPRASGPTSDARTDTATSPASEDHASAWPFWLGLGALLFANGLLVGPLVAAPGLVLTVIALVGLAHEPRPEPG